MLATFGAGCFWGVEETFRALPGVKETAVGYMGGDMPNPTYEDVCTNETGHAEVVQVEYDPQEISYDKLLATFWANHDPSQIDRQGPDVGTQYRSVVFYHSPEQQVATEKAKLELENSGKFDEPIATQVIPATPFYKAEDYHQKYYEKGAGLWHV